MTDHAGDGLGKMVEMESLEGQLVQAQRKLEVERQLAKDIVGQVEKELAKTRQERDEARAEVERLMLSNEVRGHEIASMSRANEKLRQQVVDLTSDLDRLKRRGDQTCRGGAKNVGFDG